MRLTLDDARVCLRRAMTLRRRAGVPVDFAASPVDMAQSVGVEVWYRPLPSLAGMYERTSQAIVIGSDRPLGYQASVCAHELGHHVFGHGTRIDDYNPERDTCDRDNPEEAAANLFSAHLMMPEAAVRRAFELRGWDAKSPTAQEAFVMAGVLGVGYSALITHLCRTLKWISPKGADRLLQIAPKDIRQTLFPEVECAELVVVDEHWADRPVDVTTGTVVCLPAGTRLEGNALTIVEAQEHCVVARATRRGIARADRDGWSVFVRVMPAKFSGAAVHRHMEDPDEP